MKLLHNMNPIPNFGDDINERLWDALAPGLFDGAQNTGFLGIGALVGKPFDPVDRLHVFSSGAGYGPIALPSDDVNVWCVRGPITAKLLNVDASRIVTDGALLAPLVWPAAKRKQQVVVIPHWQSLHGREAYWHEACSVAGFKLVSPMQRVEKVLEDISSASLVLTECLHGAILADAYGVPWKAWTCSSKFSAIEWKDWTASMDVPLCVSGVAAPSTSIVKKLGRPLIAKGEIDVMISDDVVENEIASRSMEGTTPPPNKRFLETVLESVTLSEWVGSNVSGYRPAETAKHLLAIASSAAPQLSAEDRRARLSQRLMDLLSLVSEGEGETGSLPDTRSSASRPA